MCGMVPAIVLTAGLGTRLRPLTDLLAKPAVPVAGKPLVVRVLEWLRRAGVEDAILNLHHLPETITAVVGDGSHLGMRVRYSWERRILGSAGGPRLALTLLPEDRGPVLVVNGDTLTDLPLEQLLDAHRRAVAGGALVTMAVVRNTRPDHYNGIRLDADDRVVAFVAKRALQTLLHRRAGPSGPAASPGLKPRGSDKRDLAADCFETRSTGPTHDTWHFVGVQVIEPSVVGGLPIGEPAETVAGLYRDLLVSSPGAVRAWRSDATFLDVGTADDYLDAAFHIDRAEGRHRDVIVEPPSEGDGRPASINEAATFDQCIVWPGAEIAADVHLSRCVVLPGARVPRGFQASGRVLTGVVS
jgi:NDP-sugar pyrophosphorylase family protein